MSSLLNVGFKYPQWEVRVTQQEQEEKLRCCDVLPDVYGDRADISYFAHESIMAAKHAGITVNGSVHMEQVFDLREPIYLNEPLTIVGEVIAVEPDPRGHRVRSRFDFRRSDGSIPLSTERMSLRIDPHSHIKGPLGNAPRVEEPDAGILVHIGTKQLVPEKVAQFNEDAENLIHSDPEVAKAFGFRAPIAGGLMAVRFMMEALVRFGPIDELLMTVRFRRPMFWDEVLDLYADRNDRSLSCLIFRNHSGKVANMARIDHLGVSAV